MLHVPLPGVSSSRLPHRRRSRDARRPKDPSPDGLRHGFGRHLLQQVLRGVHLARREREHRVAVPDCMCRAHDARNGVVRRPRQQVSPLLAQARIGRHDPDDGVRPGSVGPGGSWLRLLLIAQRPGPNPRQDRAALRQDLAHSIDGEQRPDDHRALVDGGRPDPPLHLPFRPPDLGDRGPGPGPDRSLLHLIGGRVARSIPLVGTGTGLRIPDPKVEQRCTGHDGHYGHPRGEPDPTLLQVSHDARGRAQAECASSGEEDAVNEVHGVLLAGGSAFGLGAAAGVMRYLEERGIGFAAGVAVVPIVPGAALFDLGIGDPKARPGPNEGYGACDAATDQVEEGTVGAGTGATVAKIRGPEGQVKGGIGSASITEGSVVVGALFAVNAVGEVLAEDGAVLAGVRPGARGDEEEAEPTTPWPDGPGTNTIIGVVATNARLSKERAHLLAGSAHDTVSGVVRPAHTIWDGDTVFTLATGQVDAPQDLL